MAAQFTATINFNNSEERCASCYNLGCTGCGYLFCFGGKKKSTQIKVLWGWLIVITLTVSLVLNYVIYGETSFTASETDMRAVRDKISYIFCSSVEITSQDHLFDAYLIEGELTIQKERQNSVSSTAIYLNPDEYKYFQFYFLSGSTVKVSHCSRENMSLYVIAGKSNFNLWQENKFCETCYIGKEYLFGRTDCNVLSTFSLNVSTEDSYYFIYANNPFQSTNVTTKFDLDRSVYDVSRASEFHLLSLDWYFEIDKQDQTVVFEVKQTSYHLQYNPSENFKTKCISRVWIYVLIFGVGCVLTGAISCTLIIGLCSDTHEYTNRIHVITYSERTPLLRGTTPPPSYAEVSLTPPKYEDVIIKTDKDLPSYQEAVSRIVTDY